MAMRTSTFTLDTVDGAAVYAVRWLPDREVSVRAVVQLVHGMQDHVARHQPLGVALTAAGYAVYGNDLRGHGHTAASPDELGFLAEQHGWVKLLDDLSRLTATIRREQPVLPVFLLGHSMGSLLTQQYLFTFPTAIEGALLSATTGDPDVSIELFALIAHLERARLGPRGRSRLLNTLAFAGYNRAFKPTRTPYDWLSQRPRAGRRLRRRPMVHVPAHHPVLDRPRRRDARDRLRPTPPSYPQQPADPHHRRRTGPVQPADRRGATTPRRLPPRRTHRCHLPAVSRPPRTAVRHQP
jgi:alpha-beta hydrolase superfamily lysophospholipase